MAEEEPQQLRYTVIDDTQGEPDTKRIKLNQVGSGSVDCIKRLKSFNIENCYDQKMQSGAMLQV